MENFFEKLKPCCETLKVLTGADVTVGTSGAFREAGVVLLRFEKPCFVATLMVSLKMVEDGNDAGLKWVADRATNEFERLYAERLAQEGVEVRVLDGWEICGPFQRLRASAGEQPTEKGE